MTMLLHVMGSGWFRLIGNVALLALIAWNLWLSRRQRKGVAELNAMREQLQKRQDEFTPTMIGALENMAAASCPLCAAVAGRIEIDGPYGTPLAPEAEVDGEHIVYFDGNKGVSPCLAAPVRAEARRLFAESMEEKTKEKTAA